MNTATDQPAGHTDQQIADALAQAHQHCEGLLGAALASNEGLLMSAAGDLRDESASASAAFLLGELDNNLGLLRHGITREALIWTDTGPWYLRRLDHLSYVLVLHAQPIPHPALLRHAGAVTAERIEPLLKQLFDQHCAA